MLFRSVVLGFRVVGEPHLCAVPLQLALEAGRHAAEQNPLGERPRNAEVRAGGLAALAGPGRRRAGARRAAPRCGEGGRRGGPPARGRATRAPAPAAAARGGGGGATSAPPPPAPDT